MALYRYFKLHSDSKLPDPRGPLSKEVPSTSIASAKEAAVRLDGSGPRLSLARQLFPKSCIPDVLVHVVPTHHRFNAKCFCLHF